MPREDTMVCRCEDVCFGATARRSDGRDAKLQTRCGMDEAIEAGALLTFGSFGTCRFLRIAPVGTYLIDSIHSYLFYRAEPIWGGRKAI